MKKINFLFVLALIFGAVTFAPKAHALDCKEGQSLNGDECWTSVKVSALETNIVSAGAVLVYDINTGDAERGAYEVVLATASADSHRIAGVAQKIIATGDWGRVLVKGKGKIFARSGPASGDRLFVSSSEGKAGHLGGTGNGTTIPSSDSIGFALASGSGDSAVDSYITILG